MTSQTFSDAPGGIRREGNNQTLVFTRTSPTTGTLCWSPVPPNGQACGTPSGNYRGGVLVGGTAPITQSDKPKDGTCCYNGDATLDGNLFAGDKLGDAKVLWSSNTDVATSCVTVTGLDGNCSAYYFAFFAIDNVCRYNQDGIYSYSLDLVGNKLLCTSGSQCVLTNAVDPTALMTLSPPGTPVVDPATLTFPLSMIVDGSTLNLVLRGSVLTTYQSLVDELHTAWRRLGPVATESSTPPNYGAFYTDGQQWFQYDGEKYNKINPLLGATDPLSPPVGATWLNTATNTLSMWDGTVWAPASNVISLERDPTIVECDQYWFNGTSAAVFDGVTWINVPHLIQSDDPTSAPTLTCSNVWKNGSTFRRWNDKSLSWRLLMVLQYPTDPLTPANGTYWYDPVNLSLELWNGLTWAAQAFVNNSNVPALPVANMLWLNSSTNQLQKYNAATQLWTVLPVTVFMKALNDLSVGDFWYNTTNNTLNEYTSAGWVDVSATTISAATDPAAVVTIADGTLWKKLSTNFWFVKSGSRWVGTSVIETAADPRTLASGIWYNTATKNWYTRSGASWASIAITYATNFDPTIAQLGVTWYNGNVANELRQRTTLSTWTVVPFATAPVTNIVGQRWFNPSTDTMSQWSGEKWIEVIAPYTAAFNSKNDILISSTSCGDKSYIDVGTGGLLTSILRFTLATPVVGLDGNNGAPMYAQLGVGTDGSVDERRMIIDNLYTRLGHPVINIELTRSQMDLAVQKGLDYIRRDSGAGYNRGYFFMTLNPGQQHYTLTSKSVGFNKIVDVLYLYRPRGGFLTASYGGSVDMYGQQLMQQLYTSGTFDLVTHHLMSSYQSVVAKLFAAEFQFQWTERSRVLSIQRKIIRTEKILVDAVIERTEQDLLTDRITKNWIENWALAEAKIMLGEMRGKYTSLPGAGGTVTLNAESLKAEAVAMQDKLKQEIEDFLVNDVETWGIGASITRG